MINKPFYLILHHSATRDDYVLSNFEAIKRYHMSYAIDGYTVSREEYFKQKKKDPNRYYKPAWSDIGYHAVIEMEQGEVKIKKGRKFDVTGAHAYQKMPDVNGNMVSINNQSLGVCIVGNYDKTLLEEKYLKEAVGYVSLLLVLYKIPIKNVLGHNEIPGVTKSCPGNLISMNYVRERIEDHIGWLI